MRTPDEIKKNLIACIEDDCLACSHELRITCVYQRMKEDLAYIQKLEERIDLMLIQMRGDCGTCRFRLTTSDICHDCMCAGDDPYHPFWEYEGFPGEDTKHAESV